jgi:hypothetical protein
MAVKITAFVSVETFPKGSDTPKGKGRNDILLPERAVNHPPGCHPR